MLHGVDDPIVARHRERHLVHGICDHEHIIDADTDQEEGHQIVDACHLTTEEEHG